MSKIIMPFKKRSVRRNSFVRKRGFTLIEILVATVVLSLLASGLFSVMVSGRFLVARSKLRVGAFEVAKIQIEGLRQFIRADLWENTSNPIYPFPGWSLWDNTTYAPYKFRYKVENATDIGLVGYDLRAVTVEVRWDVSNI